MTFIVPKPTYFNSRLSLELILEKVKQQPSNVMAQAAVEKIRRKSYRELKWSLEFLVLLFQDKRIKKHILPIFIYDKTVKKSKKP
jgi:hypothetical protein